jgi:hypothetical protein
VHRCHAVLEDVLVAAAQDRAVVVGRVPEVEVPLGHQVGGVREGGHPGAAVEAGVPADVVDVQVRVDHQVDVAGLHAGRGEVVQEAGVEAAPHRGVGPVLVVADAGVDEDGAAPAAQQPGLDRRVAVFRLRVPEVGGEPAAVLVP